MSKLNTINEFKVTQAILNEVKIILTINDDVLREQSYYWMATPLGLEVNDSGQQEAIRLALESHYRTPTVWISGTELKINIDPDMRIPGKKGA